MYIPIPRTPRAARLVQLPICALRLISFSFLMVFILSLLALSGTSDSKCSRRAGSSVITLRLHCAPLSAMYFLFLQTFLDGRFHCLEHFGFGGCLCHAY